MDASQKAQVAALRSFNRFYTRRIGVLEEGFLGTPFTLAQGRVLHELGARGTALAGEIAEALELDAGYLSRILKAFVARRLVCSRPAPEDARRRRLSLTAAGRRALATLDQRAQAQVCSTLTALAPPSRTRLLGALDDVRAILTNQRIAAGSGLVVRTHQPGDAGWAIERHARVYTDEFGWTGAFEGLITRLFAAFLESHDPERERFWVAELDGERVGCVFVCRDAHDSDAARLRCLLVDPRGRGHGVGRRLVAECIAFARLAGYQRVVLWTNDVLVSARRIYEAAGFRLVAEKPHRDFGPRLVGQDWALELD